MWRRGDAVSYFQPAAVSASAVMAMQLVQPGRTLRVCVCVCGSASSKLCVNDGERCLYTLIFTEIKSRKILKEWESKYAQCTIHNMPCYLKKDVNIHISLLVSSFFAAIKKMIIFVSSFVFYIKTVYISLCSVNMLEPSYVGLWMNTVWNAPLKSVQKLTNNDSFHYFIAFNQTPKYEKNLK